VDLAVNSLDPSGKLTQNNVALPPSIYVPSDRLRKMTNSRDLDDSAYRNRGRLVTAGLPHAWDTEKGKRRRKAYVHVPTQSLMKGCLGTNGIPSMVLTDVLLLAHAVQAAYGSGVLGEQPHGVHLPARLLRHVFPRRLHASKVTSFTAALVLSWFSRHLGDRWASKSRSILRTRATAPSLVCGSRQSMTVPTPPPAKPPPLLPSATLEAGTRPPGGRPWPRTPPPATSRRGRRPTRSAPLRTRSAARRRIHSTHSPRGSPRPRPPTAATRRGGSPSSQR
jgi:hypothetical protein